MAYAAWSVVAFEQPTTAKWNILGSNDAGFRDGSNLAIANNQAIQGYDSGSALKDLLLFDSSDDVNAGNAEGWFKILADISSHKSLKFPMTRRGGDAANCNTSGTTVYTNTVLLQMGSVSVPSGSNQSVTYPIAYDDEPIVFTQLDYSTGGLGSVPIAITNTGFLMRHGAPVTSNCYWLSVGLKA